MVSGNFTPQVQKTLQAVAKDQVQAEQYMDFVRNRTFRETLLVKADIVPNWAIDPETIRGLHITTTGRITASPGDVHTTETVQFQTKSGMVLSTSSGPLKAAMRELARCWPATVSYLDLSRAVNEVLATPEADHQELALGLLNTYIATDLLELHAVPIAAPAIGERPVALVAARARLAAGDRVVANRRHELIRPSDFDLKLIPLLDGTRDRTALIEQLTEKVLLQGIDSTTRGATSDGQRGSARH